MGQGGSGGRYQSGLDRSGRTEIPYSVLRVRQTRSFSWYREIAYRHRSGLVVLVASPGPSYRSGGSGRMYRKALPVTLGRPYGPSSKEKRSLRSAMPPIATEFTRHDESTRCANC